MRQDIILGKRIAEWQKEFPLLRDMMELKEVFWLNNDKLSAAQSIASSELSIEDIFDAEARLKRFAPYFCEAFPETRKTAGILESPLFHIERMQEFLSNLLNDSLNGLNDKNREVAKSSMCEEQAKDSICGKPGKIISGRLLLKCDNELPISGSIKARGGIYEVLKFAEDIALESGRLKEGDCYAVLAQPQCRELFSRYRIAVGSTGNLGLSIGIISAKLGFQVTVHMSADARQWKKDMLKDKGVTVKEYEEDYSIAVAQGRKQAAGDPYCHFVDDENSRTLFLGYSVAALRLKKQLQEAGICVDAEHPLFVYLPCGVGGGPGGVAFGLKQIYGDHVHCFFAEPLHSPCMLLGMMTGYHDKVCVQDFGIDNQTAADGLAVGRPSRFVGRLMTPFLSGIYTISDEKMYRMLAALYDEEKIALEPSALAGMIGPYLISATETGAQYIKKENLQDKMNQATHIVWATGGGMVPDIEWREYYETGLRVAF